MKVDHRTIATELVTASEAISDLVILFSARCGKNHALTNRAFRTSNAFSKARSALDDLYHSEITNAEVELWKHVYYLSYDDLPLGAPRNGVEHHPLKGKRRQPKLTEEEVKTLRGHLARIETDLAQVAADISAVYPKSDAAWKAFVKARTMCLALSASLEAKDADL